MPNYTMIYQGTDKYKHPTFYTKDPEEFSKLQKVQDVLDEQEPKPKSPIYLKPEFNYANLRPVASNFRFRPKNTYVLSVDWRIKTHEGKAYAKAYVSNSVLHAEYVEDLGKELNIE